MPPPRPPVTTLVIHTWKEHGKPRPLSNQEQSAQAARDRISKSLSHDTHLACLKQPDEELLSTHPHCRPAVVRSASVEDSLLVAKSPLSTPQLSDDDSDSSCGCLPLVDNLCTIPSSLDVFNNYHRKQDSHDALPPRPGEWPQCRGTQESSTTLALPPRAVSLLTADEIPRGTIPVKGNSKHVRTRSVGTSPFETTLLEESMIRGSSSFDAGLSDVAHQGIVQSCISPNV